MSQRGTLFRGASTFSPSSAEMSPLPLTSHLHTPSFRIRAFPRSLFHLAEDYFVSIPTLALKCLHPDAKQSSQQKSHTERTRNSTQPLSVFFPHYQSQPAETSHNLRLKIFFLLEAMVASRAERMGNRYRLDRELAAGGRVSKPKFLR